MSTLSLRYAHAFAEVAKSSNLDLAGTRQQLEDFSATLAGSPELREFLDNPSIAAPDKLKIVDALSARISFSPQVRNFIAVIMDHERLKDLPDILADYATLADEQASITDASVTTARPLDPADRAQLETRIALLSGGGQVRTTYAEDASLLGGAVVRIGSTVYDGSVRAQLQQLKEKLINA